MIFEEKKIGGLFEIQLEPREDERGFFMRTYDQRIFEEHNIHRPWVQENLALSKEKGTVRGLHFHYPPSNEAKLLMMPQGEAFWVFVDLRKGSSSFGKWESIIISAEKKNTVFMPHGLASGICTLTDNCLVAYKMDNYYLPRNEDNIKWDDPDIGIVWPIKVPSVISDRDAKAQSFKQFLEKSGGGLKI